MDLDYIEQAVTVKTTAYGANKVVGGAYQLAKAAGSPGVTLLRGVVVKEVGTQKAPLTLVFLNADPGTLADSSTPDFTAISASVVGRVNVAAADYETVGGVSIAEVEASRIMRALTGKQSEGKTGGSLWVVPVGTGTPTFAAADAVRIGFGFIRG